MRLNHNPNCPNKNCEGGVIYTTGRLCRKCNPEWSKQKVSKPKETWTRDEVVELLKKNAEHLEELFKKPENRCSGAIWQFTQYWIAENL